MTASLTPLETKTGKEALPLHTVDYRTTEGTVIGSVELDKSVFSLPVNISLLHQVVVAQLAARRSGTQSTRTRAEVKGGSAKPFRQKGTGSARQGSIRAPHFTGGGVALGPKPRSYDMRTPKKMVKQALAVALSDRAASERIVVINEWNFVVPKTKEAVAALDNLGVSGKILLVITREDETALRSFANLGYAVTIPRDQLTAYDVLGSDYVIFTKDTLLGDCQITEKAKTTPSKAESAAKKTTKAKVAKAEGVVADDDVVAEDIVKADEEI